MGCAPSMPAGFEARLRATYPSVRVVWNHTYNVWEIQECGRVTGCWHYVMFWSATQFPKRPSYRPLPDGPEPLIRALHEIDMARYGGTPASAWRAMCENLDERRRTWLANKLEPLREAGQEYGRDLHARTIGVRQTFAPGYIRQRSRPGRDHGSANMRKFAEEALKKP